MKEEAAHTQTVVSVHDFFKKRRYRQPIILVLVVNLGSQLSGFNAVSRKILLFLLLNSTNVKLIMVGLCQGFEKCI